MAFPYCSWQVETAIRLYLEANRRDRFRVKEAMTTGYINCLPAWDCVPVCCK